MGPDDQPDDRFVPKGALGQGGMGQVVLAHDRELGRDVALKLVPMTRGEVGLERFRREGETAARLEHPGIVRVHSAGVWRGRAFLAYELVEGARPLDAAFRGAPREQRVAWVLQVAQALAHAHARGVVHRDVKPSNVLVDAAGRARVTDFGLALAADMTPLTRTGALLGTPLWLPPEGFQGRRLDARGDVWALGVVLYQALVERLPFEGDTLPELGARITGGSVQAPRAVDPSVPAPLEEVCLRALQVDPARRPADAIAFAELLAHAVQGRGPPRAPRAPFAPRALLALAAALPIGGLVVWASRLGDERAAPSLPVPAAPADVPSAVPAPAPQAGWAVAPGDRVGGRLRVELRREPVTGMEGPTRLAVEVDLAGRVTAVAPELVRTCEVRRVRIESEDRVGTTADSDDPRQPIHALAGRTFDVRQEPRTGRVLGCDLDGRCAELLAGLDPPDRRVLERGLEPLREPNLARDLDLLWGGLPDPLPERPWDAMREVWIAADAGATVPVEHTLRGPELQGRAITRRPARSLGQPRTLVEPRLELRVAWDAGRVRSASAALEAQERSPRGEMRVAWTIAWEEER